ncbi:MAG: hypothetical protein JWN04_6916 [Myxococcaceae bacterium]|nr:hypothetical protein [Myxococcaceae bacterium]
MRGSVRAVVLVCMLLTACQGGRDPSSPMLRIGGKGEFTRPDRPVPALLYSDGVSRLQLQALDMQEAGAGEVRVELEEPPPDAALLDVGHLGEPKIAVAFLTAVPEDHPQQMRFVTTTTSSSKCAQDCEVDQRWCGGNFECYSESTRCPDDDSPPEACQLVRAADGDPSLKRAEPWSMLAGLSGNYAVAYVSAPLAAGSILAALLGAPNGMDAGYHVLAVGPAALPGVWSSQDASRRDCWDAAIDDAIAQINAEEGTHYESYELERPCEDEHSWLLLENSEVCDRPLAERQALRNRYDAAGWHARFQRGCPLGFRSLKPVAHGEPIEIDLSTVPAPASVQLF